MGSPRLFNRVRADKNYRTELDRLAKVEGVLDDHRRSIMRMLHIGDTQVIVADNIERYYIEHKIGLEVHDLGDPKFFPCVTPPFPRMFIEFNVSKPEESETTWIDSKQKQTEVSMLGVFFDTTQDAEDIKKFCEVYLSAGDSDLTDEENEIERQKLLNCTWLVRVNFIVQEKGKGLRDVDCERFLALDETGKCVGLYTNYSSQVLMRTRMLGVSLHEYIGTISALLHVPLLTIAFMHCKNIEMIDAPMGEYEPPKWCRRMKVGEVQYKTLRIEPVRKILEGEGNIGHNGIKKALHICRGHFAEYTKEKPLFGRVVGRVFRPAHVRGTLEQGRVEKNYEVEPPKGE
jgi:hypothetical protein